MNTFTVLFSLAFTFVLTLMAAPWVLSALRKRHASQHILEIGPKWHETKAGTPTMGGIMFIIPFVVVVLIFGLGEMLKGDFRLLISLVFVLLCALVGFIDDGVKIFKARNKGLTVRQKTMFLMLVIALYLATMYLMNYIEDSVFIPFLNYRLPLWIFYFVVMLPLCFFFVNSVNLTDGLDGLVTCVTLPYTITFTVIAYLLHSASSSFQGMGIFSAGLTGGLLAFLIYNFYPAKVFMGDTGSLFLGGAVVALAFAYDMPILLLFGGIVYLIEGLSVALQVVYFKLTHGKRLFRMAPIHHHFEMGGKNEVQIVRMMTIISVIGCVLCLLSILFYAGGYFIL